MSAEQDLDDLKAQLSSLRHDLRGILSPAMLTADRLLDHPDPAVRKAGETIMRTVERITARLGDGRGPQDRPTASMS